MDNNNPKVSFLPDGTYDLSTLEKRAAASESTLNVIAMVPRIYYSRGAQFCCDEMSKAAEKLAHQLREARTPLTPEMLTDPMIRELLSKTGGVFIAGKECCTLALGEGLERAKDRGDEAYYSARADVDLAKQYCCDTINAQRDMR